MFGCLLFALVFYGLSMVIRKQKLSNYTSIFLKQGMITLILFKSLDSFNIDENISLMGVIFLP
jgi:predicted ABC-type exoprotein transport system permease subunit